jgi:hypothetical protein
METAQELLQGLSRQRATGLACLEILMWFPLWRISLLLYFAVAAVPAERWRFLTLIYNFPGIALGADA